MRRRTALIGALVAALLVPLAATTPADAAPKTKPTVSMRVLVNAVPLRTDPVGFSGRVSGAPAGTSVALQRRSGSGWRTVGTAKTDAQGAYSVSLGAARLGRTTFRATVAATAKRKAAASRSVAVTFFGAFGLIALKPLSIDTGITAQTDVGETLGGTLTYTFDGKSALSAVWDIRGACRTLYLQAGTKSGTGRLSVTVQDTLGGTGEAYTTDLTSGDPVQARIDVRDVRLLSLRIKDTTPVAGVHVAGIQAPALLCSRDPGKGAS